MLTPYQGAVLAAGWGQYVNDPTWWQWRLGESIWVPDQRAGLLSRELGVKRCT
jgi:hypothetical protein